MTAAAIDPAADISRSKIGAPSRRGLRYLWFGLGALLWLFAVGGRWDLAAAAWLFSVFLLRFSRMSRPGLAIGLVWLASVAASLFWLWQLKIPLVPSSVVGMLIYGTLFTIPFVLDRLFWRRLPQAGAVLLFPVALAAIEFITAVFSPLGASYGLLAVTQYADLPLLQVISIAGPYAIGFLIGAFATVANLVWENSADWPKVRWAVSFYGIVLAVVIGGGGLRLAFFPPEPSYVRVAGITPSREVLDASNRMLAKPVLGASSPVSKADEAAIDPARLTAAYALVQAELLANTRIAAQAGAKIVVWSENAAVLRTEDEPAFLAKAAAVARQEHIYIDVASNVPFVRDRTRLIDPDGKILWIYDKSHPIPGMEDYAPGTGKPSLAQTPWARLANVICYDADFPGMMHAPADIMLIPGGDWPQIGSVHTLRMASLRAIENGYSIFREDFNGLSAVIDYQGRVLATQDTTTLGQHIMLAEVPTKGVVTLYSLTGDIFAWLCLLATMALIGLGIRPRRTGAA
jgi:apolipoprotein N-acyltransferase